MDHGVISSWSHIMVGIFCFVIMSVNTVPGIVSFIVQVQLTTLLCYGRYDYYSYIYFFFTASFQPPPLIEYFPVLHYVVSYNTSDNSTVIQTQLSSSISSYTVSSEPGVTYYITVRL